MKTSEALERADPRDEGATKSNEAATKKIEKLLVVLRARPGNDELCQLITLRAKAGNQR